MHAIKIGLSVSLGTCIWAFLGEKVASVTQLTYVTQLIFFTQFANVTVGSVGIHVSRLTYATHFGLHIYIGYTVGLCYTVGLRYTLAYLDLAAGDRYGCCCCETVDDRMWNIIDEKSCFHNIKNTIEIDDNKDDDNKKTNENDVNNDDDSIIMMTWDDEYGERACVSDRPTDRCWVSPLGSGWPLRWGSSWWPERRHPRPFRLNRTQPSAGTWRPSVRRSRHATFPATRTRSNPWRPNTDRTTQSQNKDMHTDSQADRLTGDRHTESQGR